ncbi:hypothetical protein CR513_04509, partial [Mucuna pruriens]
METKNQYRVKQWCPIQARIPNLQSLRYWGSCLRGQWRRAFKRKHGNLLCILEVEIDFQMALTLEEYERLLGLPLAESSHHFHQGQPPSWATIAKLLKISESKMEKERRN